MIVHRVINDTSPNTHVVTNNRLPKPTPVIKQFGTGTVGDLLLSDDELDDAVSVVGLALSPYT